MIELGFDGRQDRTPVGYFTFAVREDRWTWSRGLFELHGYDDGSVDPSTELLLRHKHPDDALRAFEVLEAAVVDGAPFSCYHRIVDTSGLVRYVLSVGRGVRGADGQVEQVTGFFVDLTGVRTGEVRDAGDQADGDLALVRLGERRATVDRAKGIVMLARGCDAREAFRILREAAALRGARLHDLADLVVARAGEPASPDARRAGVDKLLDASRSSPLW